MWILLYGKRLYQMAFKTILCIYKYVYSIINNNTILFTDHLADVQEKAKKKI